MSLESQRTYGLLGVAAMLVMLGTPLKAQRYLPYWQQQNQVRQWPASEMERRSQVQSKPITIDAVQDYDHYNERYRKVARVESVLYGDGYPQEEIHCNRASYSQFEVTLDNVKVGDRLQVRVTWDDGSTRTVEKVVDKYSYDTWLIDEPLAFDQAFDS